MHVFSFLGFPPFTVLPTCFPLYFLYFLPNIMLLFFTVTLRSYIANQVGAYHNSWIQCVRPASGLAWWNERQSLWTLLIIIAKHTLCVLASSATSERSFSKTGYIVKSRRWCLSDTHVQELSFISW